MYAQRSCHLKQPNQTELLMEDLKLEMRLKQNAWMKAFAKQTSAQTQIVMTAIRSLP